MAAKILFLAYNVLKVAFDVEQKVIVTEETTSTESWDDKAVGIINDIDCALIDQI